MINKSISFIICVCVFFFPLEFRPTICLFFLFGINFFRRKFPTHKPPTKIPLHRLYLDPFYDGKPLPFTETAKEAQQWRQNGLESSIACIFCLIFKNPPRKLLFLEFKIKQHCSSTKTIFKIPSFETKKIGYVSEGLREVRRKECFR